MKKLFQICLILLLGLSFNLSSIPIPKAQAQTIPLAPSSLAVIAASSSQINLSWQDNSSNETGFKIERSLNATSGFVQIATVGANATTYGKVTYQDSGLNPQILYYYRVRAFNAAGDSAYSNTANAMTQGLIPVGTAVDVVTDGSYAYIASKEYGVIVIDVRDPVYPKTVGSTQVGFAPTHLALEGTIVVAVGGASGMAVVNVSSPNSPVKLSSLNVPADHVAVAAGYAYLSDQNNNYIRVVNLANPSSPTVVSSFSLPVGAWPYEIAVVGSYAYVAGGWAERGGGLFVVNVSNPVVLTIVGRLALDCYVVAAKSGFVYIDGVAYGGIKVVDVSNPASPTYLSQLYVGDVLPQFVVQGNFVYAAAQSWRSPGTGGLRIINIATPTAPTLVSQPLAPVAANSVAVSGTHAYLADDTAGLQIFDVTNPANPVIVGSISGYASDAVILNKAVDKTSASSGETLTYTTTYTNTATARTNAKIEDAIPNGTTYVVGSAKLNGVAKTDAQDTDEFYFDGTKGTWTLGNLAAGATGNVSFQVRVN